METSHSEQRESSHVAAGEIDPAQLAVSPTASPKTTAAIAAALTAHRDASEPSGETGDDGEGVRWDDNQIWRFTGRYMALNDRLPRPERALPSDPWRAAGRFDQR